MEPLNVFFGQTRIGFLSIDDTRLFSFQYSKKWLTSLDAFQISISLPMQKDTFLHDKVKSFFPNLLPESAVRGYHNCNKKKDPIERLNNLIKFTIKNEPGGTVPG